MLLKKNVIVVGLLMVALLLLSLACLAFGGASEPAEAKAWVLKGQFGLVMFTLILFSGAAGAGFDAITRRR